MWRHQASAKDSCETALRAEAVGAWRCNSPAAASSDLGCTHPTQRESRPLISEVELCRCLKSWPSLGTRVKFAWLALLGVEVNPGPLLRLGSSVPRMRFLPSGLQDAMKGPPALPVFSNRIRPSHWWCRMASVLANIHAKSPAVCSTVEHLQLTSLRRSFVPRHGRSNSPAGRIPCLCTKRRLCFWCLNKPRLLSNLVLR